MPWVEQHDGEKNTDLIHMTNNTSVYILRRSKNVWYRYFTSFRTACKHRSVLRIASVAPALHSDWPGKKQLLIDYHLPTCCFHFLGVLIPFYRIVFTLHKKTDAEKIASSLYLAFLFELQARKISAYPQPATDSFDFADSRWFLTPSIYYK